MGNARNNHLVFSERVVGFDLGCYEESRGVAAKTRRLRIFLWLFPQLQKWPSCS